MRIVLTNDDGFDAPGLKALWEAVRMLGDVDIAVIAPQEPHSGCGHVFTGRMRVRETDVPPMGCIHVVEGTPVGCVCAAIHHPDWRRPDVLIAGINRGSNLGVDVYTSGTVAAARQAAIFGIPAIAVSQLVLAEHPDDWARSARETAAVLAALLRRDARLPDDVDARVYALARQALAEAPFAPPGGVDCWNVNLPRLSNGQPTTEVRLAPLSRDPVHLDYALSCLDDGGQELTYVGCYRNRPAACGTDVEANFAGAITISRLPI